MQHRIAKSFQPNERGVFEDGFSKTTHALTQCSTGCGYRPCGGLRFTQYFEYFYSIHRVKQPPGPSTYGSFGGRLAGRDGRAAQVPQHDAEFNALKKELAKWVMEEQMRYTETEIKGYTAD